MSNSRTRLYHFFLIANFCEFTMIAFAQRLSLVHLSLESFETPFPKSSKVKIIFLELSKKLILIFRGMLIFVHLRRGDCKANGRVFRRKISTCVRNTPQLIESERRHLAELSASLIMTVTQKPFASVSIPTSISGG